MLSMARNGLPLLVCALLSATPLTLSARPEEVKSSNKIDNLLAVNRALNLGRDYLKGGQNQAAVNVLEAQLPSVNGNKDYLLVLRDAYRALIDDLRRQRRIDEIATYQRRLDVLVGETLAGSESATAVLPPPPGTVPVVPVTPPSVPTTTTTSPVVNVPSPVPSVNPGKNAGAVIARGVPPEDPMDPFSEANSKQAQKARQFLVRAEKEFVSGHYSSADDLYKQAWFADESALSEARNRWAYCRLFDVNEALKRPSLPSVGELEQEVRNALSLAPGATELSKFGEDLLRTIQMRSSQVSTTTPAVEQPPPVQVRHTKRVQGSEWAIVDTPNFRIYHNLDEETATQAARTAEAARSTAFRKWFGNDGGVWNPRCDLYLHANGQVYASSTGQSAECPGHSSVGQSGERIYSRKIDIHVDAANWMTGVLPHETTHVVIAGHFGPRPVPRWADEGMAVLSEPRELVQRHLRNLPQHRQDQQLFAFRELLTLDNYPSPRQVGAFYAQSVSLVDYLSRQPGGPQEFSNFLRDGLRDGYDASLKKHYGLNSLQELQGYWTRYAFPDSGAQPVASSGYAP
jgi:hypothetical protein